MPNCSDIPFSDLTFLWVGVFGWKQMLQRSIISLKNLPNLSQSFEANYLLERFNKYWELELTSMQTGQEPSLWKALLKTIRMMLVYLSFVSIAFLSVYFVSIFTLIWLIGAIENVQLYNKFHLVSIAFLLAICTVLQSVLRNTFEYGFNVIGMKFRIMLTTAIYQRLLAMSHTQIQNLSIGNIVTLVTSDMYKFDTFFNVIPCILLTPISILLITGLTTIWFGWISMLVFAFFIIHLMIQVAMGCAIYPMYQRALKCCDRRNKCMREFIEGFRLIKCFAWEYAVAEAIKQIRKREILTLLVCFFIRSLSICLAISFPLLYILPTCLGAYVLTGGVLTTSSVFGFLAFMTMYFELFGEMGAAILGLSELFVSVNRVRNILKSPVMKKLCFQESGGNKGVINVVNLTAGRINERNSIKLCVRDISLNLKKGEILSVMGKVGSGKSSLLLALMNELDVVSGAVRLIGSCAYVPQEPWILPTSIRDNITYGRAWHSDWYQEVVSSCCLETDFAQFLDGDLTLVGERGITLSGGQKARISLARAIYFNADIYLLDDPLSSVDTQVARDLFSIFRHTILSSKTVILATHQLKFAQQTDRTLHLDSGKQIEVDNYCDPPNTLHSKESSHLMHEYIIEDNKEDIALDHLEEPRNISEQTTEKVTHFNGISLYVFAKYIWAGGKFIGIVSILFFSIVPYFSLVVGTNYYLVWWITAQETQSNATTLVNSITTSQFNPLLSLSTHQRIYLFAVICVLISLLLFAANLTFNWIPLFSSYRLHETLLWRVLRAPSLFYYTHSTGSIINRFSKDTFTMEHILPYEFGYFGNHGSYVLFLAISSFFSHWLAVIPNLLLLLVLALFRYQLTRTIRQIKRIESAAKSDVISHVSLSLHGITTIHSLQLEEYQNNRMCQLEDVHSKCWRVFFAFVRSFACQLNIVVAMYTLAVAIILIMLRENISPVVTAFVLSQLFNLLNKSQYILRLSAEIEMHMVSVERVIDYINIPQEAALTLTGYKFQVTRGDIEFKNVQLRYSSDFSPALKGVSFRVEAGERLGIVGRTGAGKTSLQTALLRLVEITSGQITIDGVDISSVGLHDLRGEISIIPQDPVLFSGSLRFALDPFSSFQDEQLWQSLKEVQLSEKIISLEGQLYFSVSEGGSNFSVGERQLLCLARAILKRSKIIMLDEATSNVDSVTDFKIQQVLSNKFKDCTLLTIAHRIESIIDYDKVLVMDKGEIIECDTPHTLMQDPSSRFSNLVGNMII